MSEKPTIRYRWGIQRRWKDRGWSTLGAGWMIARTTVDHFDYWPASFETRARARQEAKALRERSAMHSPDWRFRAVKLELRTRVVAMRKTG